MSFDFSDLVIPDDDANENVDNYDYTQFLTDPIYDWLNIPEEILQVCDDIEEKRKKEKLQLFNKLNHSKLTTLKKYHIVEVHTAKRNPKIIKD